MDMAPVPARTEDAHGSKTTKLIGNGLGLHPHGSRQIPHAGIIQDTQRLQKPKAGCSSERFEKMPHTGRFFLGQKTGGRCRS